MKRARILTNPSVGESAGVSLGQPGMDPGLHALLNPSSVVVIGASTRPGHFGNQAVLNLKSYGFSGALYAIHPTADEVHGVRCVPSLEDLGQVPDLAVVVVRSEGTAKAIRECATKGIKAAVVIASGFAETGDELGLALQEELIRTATETGVRLCGPNTLGAANFNTGAVPFVSANIPTDGLGGSVAVVSQSGGVGFTILNRAWSRGIGVGHLVVAGNEADLTISDFIDGLLETDGVDVIMCYLEAIRGGRRLVEVVRRAVERGVPVVMLKGGRSQAGERAAAAHTGAVATPFAVFEGVMRQAGGTVVQTVDEALAVVDLVQRYGAPPDRRRVGVYGMGGGLSVMLADRLEGSGLELPSLSDDSALTIKEILPDTTPGNPFDSGGLFFSNLGEPLLPRALGHFIADDSFDILVVGCMPVRGSRETVYGEAITAAAKASSKPCVVLHYGAPPLTDGMSRLLKEADLPVFDPPESGVAGLASWLRMNAGAGAGPGSGERGERTERDEVVQQFSAWFEAGRTLVTEYDAMSVIAQYGAPVAASRIARSAEEVIQAAADLRAPLVLKALSESIIHRSAVGAVVMGITGPEQITEAWQVIDERVRAARGAPLDQVIVQEMQPSGLELLVGIKNDREFGHVIVLGLGGVGVEALDRIAVRLPGLSEREVVMMFDDLGLERDAARLAAAVQPVIAAVCQLITDHAGQIDSLDLNPVIVDSSGQARVVDALIVLSGR